MTDDAPKRRRGWMVVDWRLFAAMAAALAAGSVFIAVYRIGSGEERQQRLNDQEVQIDRLSIELECRSRAAGAGTLANLDLTAATGRGLAVLAAVSQDDPELTRIVTEELGAADPAELRKQTLAALEASNLAEEARVEREGSETECRRIAREATED